MALRRAMCHVQKNTAGHIQHSFQLLHLVAHERVDALSKSKDSLSIAKAYPLTVPPRALRSWSLVAVQPGLLVPSSFLPWPVYALHLEFRRFKVSPRLHRMQRKCYGQRVLETDNSWVCRTVPIRDTDDLREVCSGMWGGKEAFIEGESECTFNLYLVQAV